MKPERIEIIESTFTIPAYRYDTISIIREGKGTETYTDGMVKEVEVDENGCLLQFNTRGTPMQLLFVIKVESDGQNKTEEGLQNANGQEGQQNEEERSETEVTPIEAGTPAFDIDFENAKPRGPAIFGQQQEEENIIPGGLEEEPQDEEENIIPGGLSEDPDFQDARDNLPDYLDDLLRGDYDGDDDPSTLPNADSLGEGTDLESDDDLPADGIV